MKLALFDLDNTLLDGDSDYCWAQYLIERGILDRGEYERKNEWFYHHYKQGTLDIHHYLDFQLAPMAGRPREVIDEWHREFMETKIRPIIHARTPALLASHAGALRAIVTATNRFITAPIVAALGVEHFLATEPEVVHGRYTGDITGIPTFQHGKVQRLAQWLEQTGYNLAGAWFYSDSHNDLPLLEQVDHPVAVDPDDTLRSHAEAKGWDIITLRQGEQPRPLAQDTGRGED